MSRQRTLVLLGGGGHGAVVAEAARAEGWSVVGFLDDVEHHPQAKQVNLKQLGAIEDLANVLASLPKGTAAHAAVGDPAVRRRWLDAVDETEVPAIIHPSAVVSPSATITEGAFIGPGAIVNARAVIDRGVIVNSGALIEHDCVLEAFCHVAPGAVLGGRVTVGRDALVGLNATVLPGVRIGAAATLGAGAVAVSDIPEAATAVGVPAKALVCGASSAQDPA